MKNQFSIKFPSSLSNKSSYLMSSPPPNLQGKKDNKLPLSIKPPPLYEKLIPSSLLN